ncbi:uncharacterized protein PAC_05781 [Phialocephala subalpina]|uniref:2EXR domain-containing protein n=1 Tax=Phialocephala subalpina TaxID=576137 RepID=A0A1L7WT07_9HELO|nr:uncharacterized protein PAC_05781 [Phialocephala subalpina]
MAESKPLTYFHPFPRLPIELRLKMYHIAMQEPRLIGIEWIRNENSYHVVPSSRTPPALFHLCQESRAEASTVYEKRVFQSPWASIRNRNNEAPYIWYNAGVDIILFGDKCSSDTVLAFIRDRHVVQRLAVNTNGKHAIDVLSAFHGSRNAMLPKRHACDGCSGLKEVFVIVDSRLWNGETCRSNPRVSLRQATSSGSTEAEVRSLRGFESAITSCIIPRSYLYSRFEKWHGGKGPKFKFVSFAPIVMDNDPRVYDGMSVGRIPAKFFLQQQKKLLDDLEQRTGCSILISAEDNDSLTTTEVGFHGSKKLSKLLRPNSRTISYVSEDYASSI